MGGAKQDQLKRQPYEEYFEAMKEDILNDDVIEITSAVLEAADLPDDTEFFDMPEKEAVDLLIEHLTEEQIKTLGDLVDDQRDDEAFDHAVSKDD
jgi:hypothetical protein